MVSDQWRHYEPVLDKFAQHDIGMLDTNIMISSYSKTQRKYTFLHYNNLTEF